jgi:Carbohydrate-selective porin, OprB family/S-layer homology domain
MMNKVIFTTIFVIGTSTTATVFPAVAIPDVSVSSLQGNSTQVSQVSSVSELTDVDPNSWAFQALKSLVERYGCIEGYPSKKYLGNRPLSRYEFAAGLNACLDKVGEQIAAATGNLATKDDLVTVQRLQEEFKTELVTLKGRVDSLEAKTKELEAQQFSITTKLAATEVFGLTGGGAGGDVTLPGATGAPAFGDSDATGIGDLVTGSSANSTFVSRTRLNFITTFTGDDLLTVRLAANTGDDVSAAFGAPFYAGDLNYSENAGGATNGRANVAIDQVTYSSKIGENFRYFVGTALDPKLIVDTNSFANNEEGDFSSTLFINNPFFFEVVGGDNPGAGFDWSVSKNVSLRAVYNAAKGGQSFGFGNGGFFGGASQILTELEVKPSETSAIRLQYARINEQGTALTAALAGNISNSTTDVFGVNAEWAITPSFGIFGRYGTANTHVNSAVDSYSDISSNTYQIGFSLPDLFAPGNRLGVSFGQPIRVNAGAQNGIGLVPSGRQSNIEVFYSFKLNDNITLTPDLQFISQPNNIANNLTITVGALRMVFTF